MNFSGMTDFENREKKALVEETMSLKRPFRPLSESFNSGNGSSSVNASVNASVPTPEQPSTVIPNILDWDWADLYQTCDITKLNMDYFNGDPFLPPFLLQLSSLVIPFIIKYVPVFFLNTIKFFLDTP
uniref:Uncharacterized protein n=1 Tax=Phlegmariurus squarrosus TaxID=73615 RepID=H9M853_PHLSQ|nr:hypothetical protein HusqMp62 [Phlegmariurus squarrosus]AEV55760.1 hypothetical protein HusqMp62 [Phlegmariurus squarrosus]